MENKKKYIYMFNASKDNTRAGWVRMMKMTFCWQLKVSIK